MSTAADGSGDATRPELDRLPADEIVDLLLDAEARVLPAVRAAGPDISAAAELVAKRWSAGGRLIFVGAGTSGRIAWAEAAELPGTFGLSRDRVLARIAGGNDSTDHDEDDHAAAARDLADLRPAQADVLVAVAASGSTPYTVAVARAAAEAGAAVIAVVTVTGSPLADLAHRAGVAIEAVVGAELLRESTRLGAGTAQKLVLNALTTTAAARLGRVHGDHMIDVEPANAKLRERVVGIVAEVAGCDLATAGIAVDKCDGNARAAVLMLVLGLAAEDARTRAAAHPTLRAALDAGR